jgi:hypothetical protein
MPVAGQTQILNPAYVTDDQWDDMCIMHIVCGLIRKRIPPTCHHIISTAGKGDVQEMLKAVYGKAYSDPKTFCGLIKEPMIGLKLGVHTFDNTANQWLVKMAEGFMALEDCKAAEDAWRMSEDDFVKRVMNRLKEFMPKFHDIYATGCDRDQSWSRATLDKMILLKQQKRQMEVEDAVRTKLVGIRTKANQVKGDPKSPIKKKKRMSEHGKALDGAYAQGINDQSCHNDSYYDQDVDEGKLSRGKYSKPRGKGGGKGKDGGKGSRGTGRKGGGKGGNSTRPKYHCNICRDLEEEDYIWMGHDKLTCNRPGGGMEGESISKCKRMQREQSQSAWRQRSNKSQGSIPEDHEQESNDESEEQNEE